MNRVFRKRDGTVVDPVKYTLRMLGEYPDIEIHIGTDSQNVKRKTIYATVIAYRFNKRGVHYIYSKYKVKKVKDMFQKLWKETTDSIEVAEWLTSKINVNVEIEIDMDYNKDDRWDSNKLLAAARGYANGLGYKVNAKHCSEDDTFENYATKAADYHCNH